MDIDGPAPAFPPPRTNDQDVAAPQRYAGGMTTTLDDYLAPSPPPPAPAAGHSVAPTSLGGLQVLGAKSSKNTVLLHERCQEFAIPLPKPEFVSVGETTWGGTVQFLGETLEERGPLPSKPAVKEALSGQALEVMRRHDEAGTLKKPIKAKGKKKKAAADGGMDGAKQAENEGEEKEPFVNYFGKLLEFQRSRSAPEPTYQDYGVGVRFASTCTVDGIDAHFGATDALFSTKKAARHHAARCAVEYFKAEGLWPEETECGSIRKKGKKATPPSTEPTPIGTSLDSLQDVGGWTASGATAGGGGPSYASRVTAVALELGLGAPEWRYADEGVKDFHTVACYFQVGGEEKGPLGEVRHVYGRKRAKEECAEATFGLLMTLREARRARARQRRDGVSGLDVDENGGVPIYGETTRRDHGLGRQDNARMEKEMELDHGQDTDDDEFEDAAEEFVRGDV